MHGGTGLEARPMTFVRWICILAAVFASLSCGRTLAAMTLVPSAPTPL
jgi:hypothetical protein